MEEQEEDLEDYLASSFSIDSLINFTSDQSVNEFNAVPDDELSPYFKKLYEFRKKKKKSS